MLHNVELNKPLILNKEDWNSSDWKLLVQLFCGTVVNPNKVEDIRPVISIISYTINN